jgi:hypothetical protein
MFKDDARIDAHGEVRSVFVGGRGHPVPGHGSLTCGNLSMEGVVHGIWIGVRLEKSNGQKTMCVLT